MKETCVLLTLNGLRTDNSVKFFKAIAASSIKLKSSDKYFIVLLVAFAFLRLALRFDFMGIGLVINTKNTTRLLSFLLKIMHRTKIASEILKNSVFY